MDFCAICLGGVQVFRVHLPVPSVPPAAEVDGPVSALDHMSVEKLNQWAGAEAAVWSRDGLMLALGVSKNVIIASGDSLQDQRQIALPDLVKHMVFSPRGTFMLSCTRGSPGTDPVAQLWDISTCQNLMSTPIKSFARQWPLLVWTEDETFAFQLGPEGVKIFDSKSNNFAVPTAQLHVALPQLCVPSPEVDGRCLLAVFKSPPAAKPTKEAVDSPTSAQASVAIYDLSKLKQKPLGTTAAALQLKPMGTISLGKANGVNILWNKSADAILACALSECDETHRFYEGSSSLHFYRIAKDPSDPSNNPNNIYKHVVPPDKGPVHDVSWSPTEDEFAMSTGPMPPQLTLCSGKTGEPKLSFGRTRRNTLRFGPFGSLIAFGGFGNLPGDLDVWDIKAKDKECIASTKAPCTIQLEWAPDGRHLMAATTTPRLRVDNCIKILHYSGVLRSTVKFDVLYAVQWRPAAVDAFVDRPPTPGRCGAAKSTVTAVDRRTASYRPPGSSGALASFMRAERQKEQQQKATTVRPGTTAQRPAVPPGAAPAGKGLPPGAAPAGKGLPPGASPAGKGLPPGASPAGKGKAKKK